MIGNIYNKKEYIPSTVSTHVECVVVIYRDKKAVMHEGLRVI
ncbi:hypothetical protein KAI37_03810 [Paenibacillus sp. S25]|nr:hypothetical protein KAI37_03810 [Paenibacillus sp. S25]